MHEIANNPRSGNNQLQGQITSVYLDNAEEVNKPYKQKVLFARIRELSDTHASSDTIVLALIQLQQYTRSTLQQALAKSMTVEMYNRIVSNNDAWLALATISTTRQADP